MLVSHVQLLATPWTVACKVPLSMEFPRQEYWSGLSSPSPGDLPDPGIEPGSPALEADSLLSEIPGKPSLCSYSSLVTFFAFRFTLYDEFKKVVIFVGYIWLIIDILWVEVIHFSGF